MLENQLNQCFMVIFSFFIVRRSGNPGGNDDLWNKRVAIYDTEDRSIHLNFDELADFGSSIRKLIELGFSLYNGYKANVLNTFSGLDEENFDLAIAALRIRFNQ